MNKQIYKKELNKIITKLDLTGDTVIIKFSDSEKILLRSYHEQDCCEKVYADFSILKYHIKSIEGKKIKEFIIKGVKDIGFLLCFKIEDSHTEKIFIPCYNIQNGYYSDDLYLEIVDKKQTSKINIREFTEDNIG